ncbi:MAG: FAD binding domain-containing protein, partial [Conexivisphaera sp.]
MSGLRVLRPFDLINAGTVDDAVRVLAKGNAWSLAGGTDIIHVLRFRVLPEEMYPDVLVNLKTISPSLDYVKYEDDMLKIGALSKLHAVAKDTTIK